MNEGTSRYMRILHYILGLPPVRNGGLIKYALDLANEQAGLGHEVCLLMPGAYDRITGGVSIKKSSYQGLDCYIITNPLPVTMGWHLYETELLYRKEETPVFNEFLKQLCPNIVHIHSFMGLHREFLQAAKELKIGIIYTTHDYYGLCPGITLLHGKTNCTEQDWTKCRQCINKDIHFGRVAKEQSEYYARLKKSLIYRWAEYSPIVRPVKKGIRYLKARHSSGQRVDLASSEQRSSDVEKYDKLREYYHSMYELVDFFHFNSTQTQEVFKSYLGDITGDVLTISNKNIADNRVIKKYEPGSILKIGYLGSNQYMKGFPVLLKAFDLLFEENVVEFKCYVFFNYYGKKSYIKQRRPYEVKQMKEVFSMFDVIIIPSMCKETFGMVVLEALSYGIPVIITNNVGAKDIMDRYPGCGIITKPNEICISDALKSVIQDRNILREMNQNICDAPMSLSYTDHVKDMLKMYDLLIRR